MAQKPDMSQFKSNKVKFDKEGDTFSGVLTSIEVKPGISGDPKLVLTLDERTTGEAGTVWCPTDLAQQIAELDPEIGSGLAITLTGFKHTGQPQPMKLFDVEEWTPGSASNSDGSW